MNSQNDKVQAQTEDVENKDITDSIKASEESLKHLEFLSRYLPRSVRKPLLWIGATLLAFPIISLLFRLAVGQTAPTVATFVQNPIAAIVVVLVVAIVLFAGFVEAWSRSRLKSAERDRYAKRLKDITAATQQTSEEDKDLLIKDSEIVKEIGKQENRNRPQHGPYFASRIIAIVSGKGGVGKSLISLGLLEVFTRDEKALLIDFDLHNRGLTSLLLDLFGKQPSGYVIDLLKDFLEEPSLLEILKEYSAEPAAADVSPLTEKFRKLTLKYSGVEPHASDRLINALGFEFIPKAAVKLDDPIKAYNGFFLPSIRVGGSFLGSKKIRDASEDAAFLFFKALSYRARAQNGIQNLIVDCHGAHDLYTVGLIRAATDLVIVTTPDMGSLDGTNELVQFGQKVTYAGGNDLPRSVLVVNRCIQDDLNAEQLHEKWKGDLSGGVIRIERDDAVERIARNYRFGSVAAQRNFWKHVEGIKSSLQPKGALIKQVQQVPIGAGPIASVASPPANSPPFRSMP